MVPPSAFSGSALSPQTVLSADKEFRTPYTLQTVMSLEKQLTKSANISVTYLTSRGDHQFYTNFINANAPGATCRRATILYQYQSEGVFKQNQLIANGSIRMGAKLTHVWLLRTELCEQRYRTTHVRAVGSARSIFGLWASTVRLPKPVVHGRHGWTAGRVSAESIFDCKFGQQFNITTGDDLFGDAQFSARPAFGDCSTPSPNLVQTKFGCFNTTPAAGAALIPINDLRGRRGLR